jgi:hypothetical protein
MEPVMPLFGDFIPCGKKSRKKGENPLEFTGKAYIFVGFDYLPKILSIKNLSCANDLEKPYLFKP